MTQPLFRVNAGLDRFARRYYQDDALASLQEGIAKGEHSQLVVMATGLGKTVLFSHLIRESHGSVLVVAHRDELIEQARQTAEALTGEYVEVEQADLHSYKARIVVGSVQSLRRPERLKRIGRERFKLVIVDECFPAGTIVDGMKIETIRPGDEVWCVDHDTGLLAHRPVVRVFARDCRARLVKLWYDASEIACTPSHPIFVKGKGYVRANEVVAGDMLCVWADFRAARMARPTAEGMLGRVSEQDLIGDYGADQFNARFFADEAEQPNAQEDESREDGNHAPGDWTSSAYPRRERNRGESGRESCSGSDGHANADCRASGEGPEERLADSLQDRRGVPDPEDRDRSGRGQSRHAVSTGAGREEGRFLAWVRVDRVARNQSPGSGGTRVYNLEVEGAHTYFANDALVHNCHHATSASYRTVMDWFEAPIVGFTATPDRTDEKALGTIFDRVAYSMDIQEGIEQGWLVPFQGHRVVLDSVKLDMVGVTAGDLAQNELDEAMVSSVEGIAHETSRLAEGRQSIAFFPGVRSAELAASCYSKLGVPACVVSGGTPKDERRQIISDFRRGIYRVLANCQVATEGFDVPEVSCIIQGRPTLSRQLYAQMIGRGGRVLPGVADMSPGRDESSFRRAAISASRKPDCMIVDCVGNSTRHSLISPVDALGGNFDPEVVALAKKKAKAGDDPLRALRNAQEELRAIAAKTKANIQATHSRFDPFSMLGVAFTEEDRYATRFGMKPMTEGQQAVLVKLGVADGDMKDLSKRAASQLLDEIGRRRASGLATYKQVRVLQKYGVADAKKVAFSKATDGLNYIAGLGWGRHAIDPHKLHELLFGQRQTGED